MWALEVAGKMCLLLLGIVTLLGKGMKKESATVHRKKDRKTVDQDLPS